MDDMLQTNSIFFDFLLLPGVEMRKESIVEFEKEAIVIFHGLVATGLDFFRSRFDLGFNFVALFFGEVEEAGEALHGAGFPIAFFIVVFGEWGDLRPRPPFLFASEMADAIAAEKNG